MKDHVSIAERLEYLREELRAERISYSEIAELQDYAEFIDPSDVELLQAAGVPEFEEEVNPMIQKAWGDIESAYDLIREEKYGCLENLSIENYDQLLNALNSAQRILETLGAKTND